jgi:hypothetical protein
MRAKRLPLTPPQLVVLIALFAALVVAFYPLLVSATISIGVWVAANHAAILACFTHGC